MTGLLIAILRIYEFIIIIRAVISWTGLRSQNPVLDAIMGITEPILRRIRSWTVMGNVDFSPVVVIVGIEIVILFLRGLY